MKKRVVILAQATAQANINITTFNYTLPDNCKKCVLKVFANHYNFVFKEKLHLTSHNKSELITYDLPLYSTNEAPSIKAENGFVIDYKHFQFARFQTLEIYPKAGQRLQGIIEQAGHGSAQPNRRVQVILEMDLDI